MVDTKWLKRQGIDSKSIHDYVARGWLERLIRGLYRRPLPEGVSESPDAAWQILVLSMQRIMEYDVHLGGESALALSGLSHYLSLGRTSRIHLYGNVPSWLKRLDAKADFVVHGRTLFGDDQTGIGDAQRDTLGSDAFAVHTVNIWRWRIRASSPERAILEALNELPKQASFHQLDTLFEGLDKLRPKQLAELLPACKSVKVRRLFFVFADRHRHPWRRHVDASAIDLGSGPRALVEGGKLHPAYHIYVPAEFIPLAETPENADA